MLESGMPTPISITISARPFAFEVLTLDSASTVVLFIAILRDKSLSLTHHPNSYIAGESSWILASLLKSIIASISSCSVSNISILLSSFFTKVNICQERCIVIFNRHTQQPEIAFHQPRHNPISMLVSMRNRVPSAEQANPLYFQHCMQLQQMESQ